jgi:DNA replication and repair protein RecF
VRLLAVSISDFRNLAQLELQASPRATVVVGQNGQGKTNLLEAIYFLATLKPLRPAKLADLIRFGSSSARVSGRFIVRGAEREISVQISPGARQAFVDEKKAPSLEEYFGGVSVVAFTPDDLGVVKGGPDARRGFLDRAVFNRFPAFLKESRVYARALKSRNRLLKEGAARPYLEAFDETLSGYGARIWTRRRALLSELASRAESAFAEIARATEKAHFDYSPSSMELNFAEAQENKLAQALRDSLRSRTSRDLERGFTSVGPHVDDLNLLLGDHAARSFASQGQQRALVLALKIAEIENLRDAIGFLPLLLLDDVSSELDPERNAYLMDYLARSGVQVFLTTTAGSLVSQAAGPNTLWCEIRSGQLLRNTPERDGNYKTL